MRSRLKSIRIEKLQGYKAAGVTKSLYEHSKGETMFRNDITSTHKGQMVCDMLQSKKLKETLLQKCINQEGLPERPPSFSL